MMQQQESVTNVYAVKRLHRMTTTSASLAAAHSQAKEEMETERVETHRSHISALYSFVHAADGEEERRRRTVEEYKSEFKMNAHQRDLAKVEQHPKKESRDDNDIRKNNRNSSLAVSQAERWSTYWQYEVLLIKEGMRLVIYHWNQLWLWYSVNCQVVFMLCPQLLPPHSASL